MRSKEKELKRAMMRLRGMASSGVLECSQTEALVGELKQLDHAIAIGDQKRIVRAVNRIARLFLKN
jgi:hypothetical protein